LLQTLFQPIIYQFSSSTQINFFIHLQISKSTCMVAANPISTIDNITTKILKFNSLTSTALFIGIGLTKITSIDNVESSYQIGIDAAQDLTTYEIIACLFTILSTILFQASTILVWLGLPPYIARRWIQRIINLAAFYLFTLNIIFLMLSLRNYVQIEFGVVSCGGKSTASVSVMFYSYSMRVCVLVPKKCIYLLIFCPFLCSS